MMQNDFILASPGPIAFYICGWAVRWYGIFIAISFLSCYFLAEKLTKKYGLNEADFNNLVFLVLISSIIFARLYYVLLNHSYYSSHAEEIPMIWLGGQTIHGGILGGVLAIFLYSKIKKISSLVFLDLVALVAPLGQAIGRWGNFFNNEAFGKPISSSFLKLYIPVDFRPLKYANYKYFHPTFLYESILNLVIFIILYKNYDKWKNIKGKIFWTYLLLYSIIRFILEFIRTDSLYIFDHMASGHVISLALIIVSLIMLFFIKSMRIQGINTSA